MEAPGKGLLKVVGILFIIRGVILLIIALLAMLGAAMMQNPETLQALEQQGVAVDVSGGAAWLAAIVALVAAALDLVTGILGVKNSKKPEKAQTCFIMGIIIIAFLIVNAAISAVDGSLNIIWTAISLVLPVLYLWGALKNKEALSGSSQGEV